MRYRKEMRSGIQRTDNCQREAQKTDKEKKKKEKETRKIKPPPYF
jgi:hypothetical protein